MICECGGILLVKRIEEVPRNLPKEKQALYDRVCDVECIECGKILYSQPYDFGKSIKIVRELKGNKGDA